MRLLELCPKQAWQNEVESRRCSWAFLEIALSYNHVDLKHPLLLLARRRIMPQDLEFRRGAYFWAFGVMAGLGTDDRRSAQPLAPREQLRFTYFLLWDWSAQKSPGESVVPQGDFRKK